jgi:hypothetical protein
LPALGVFHANHGSKRVDFEMKWFNFEIQPLPLSAHHHQQKTPQKIQRKKEKIGKQNALVMHVWCLLGILILSKWTPQHLMFFSS